MILIDERVDGSIERLFVLYKTHLFFSSSCPLNLNYADLVKIDCRRIWRYIPPVSDAASTDPIDVAHLNTGGRSQHVLMRRSLARIRLISLSLE
jgi:hypothetical protein